MQSEIYGTIAHSPVVQKKISVGPRAIEYKQLLAFFKIVHGKAFARLLLRIVVCGNLWKGNLFQKVTNILFYKLLDQPYKIDIWNANNN